MKLNKRNNQKNISVARFILDEVKYNPEISKTEKYLDLLFMFMFSLITAICNVFASFECSNIKYNKLTFVGIVVIAQLIIFIAMYRQVWLGKRMLFAIVNTGLIAGVIVARKMLLDGLLYISSHYIEVFNEVNGTDFLIEHEYEYNEKKATLWVIVIVAVIILIITNYIIINYTSSLLLLLLTFPFMLLPLLVGMVPKTVEFVIYMILSISLLSTRKMKKRKLGKKKNLQRKNIKYFVDAPVCKRIVMTIVSASLISFIIYFSVPDKYNDENYMRQRHKTFEKNVLDTANDSELGFKWVDQLLGADDLEIGNAKRRNSKYDETIFDKELWEKSAKELAKKLMDKRLLNGNIGFVDSYEHGNLNSFDGKANISKSKLYELIIEETKRHIYGQYIKNYEAEIYRNGEWISYAQKGKNDWNSQNLIVGIKNLDKRNCNEFIYSKSGIKERKMILKEVKKNFNDTIYEFLPQQNLDIVEDDGKITYGYTIYEGDDYSQCYNPYEISKLETYYEYGYQNDTQVQLGDESDGILQYVDYYDEEIEEDFSSLYDVYTSIPEEIKSELYSQLGIENYDISDIKYYIENNDYVYTFYNEMDAIYRVASFLEENCVYTLTPNTTTGVDPVLDFIANTHEGYCMHFASAATLMLRAQGVPARYVEGYMIDEGELNKNRKKRNNDELFTASIYGTNAHAWVEVYLPGIGWTPQEMTLGRSKDGKSFSEIAIELREETNKDNELDFPTKTPTKTPTKEPTKELQEDTSSKPSQSPNDKEDDVSADSNVENNNDDNTNDKISDLIIKIMVSIVIVVIGIAIIYIGIVYIGRIRQRKRKKLQITKYAYYFINKRLMNLANKKGVSLRGNVSYEEFAKSFSKLDKNISYEDALEFVSIQRKTTYGKDGIDVNDVEKLKVIYNTYMSNETREWNKLKLFIRIKIMNTVIEFDVKG